MEKEEFIKWLINDFGFKLDKAEVLYKKFLLADHRIREALLGYKEKHELPDFEFKGFSVKSLMETYNMSVVSSLFTLDWMIRDPEKAIKALNRGYDTIFNNNNK